MFGGEAVWRRRCFVEGTLEKRRRGFRFARCGGAAFGFVMVLRGLVFSVFPAFLCFGFRTMHGFFVMRIDIGSIDIAMQTRRYSRT
jgi:hypothetical protein